MAFDVMSQTGFKLESPNVELTLDFSCYSDHVAVEVSIGEMSSCPNCCHTPENSHVVSGCDFVMGRACR